MVALQNLLDVRPCKREPQQLVCMANDLYLSIQDKYLVLIVARHKVVLGSHVNVDLAVVPGSTHMNLGALFQQQGTFESCWHDTSTENLGNVGQQILL
jgi:hypothetical protein